MTEYILAPWLGMSGDAIVAGYAGSGGVSEITAAGTCCGFSCARIAFETHSTEQSRSTNQPKCFMVRYDTANVSMANRRPSVILRLRAFAVPPTLGLRLECLLEVLGVNTRFCSLLPSHLWSLRSVHLYELRLGWSHPREN